MTPFDETPEYRALYGEVVTEDCYRLRTIRWQPDVIFDIGANLGVFTRFARSLFPGSLIVAVEPHPANFQRLRELTPGDERIIFVNRALGSPNHVWRCRGASNGARESYLTPAVGYSLEQLETSAGYELSPVLSYPLVWLLDDFLKKLVKNQQRTIVKIDSEGGENSIFTHSPSLWALSRIDYLAMEVHFFADNGGCLEEVRETIMGGLATLEATHVCEFDSLGMKSATMFYAQKRELVEE